MPAERDDAPTSAPAPAPGSTASLRSANQRRVIRLLQQQTAVEPLTQADIARSTQLAPATVSNIVRDLTAAVITPVGSVKSMDGDWTQGDGQPGEVTMKLRKGLLDIQTGVAEDPHGWMHQLG